MKYFAIRLPVEGEIKEGEKYFHPTMGLIVCGKNSTKNGKLAKLFLCSRDIQIGDKVLSTKHEYKEPKLVIEDNEDLKAEVPCIHKSIIDKYNFKVIGEISPEATWVKEGDEFEENDVHFEGWEGLICPAVEEDTLEAYMSHGYVEKHPELKLICTIKGPCGHFH